MCKRESEEVHWREEVTGLIYGVVYCTWSNSILNKFCWVVSPKRVSRDKSLCFFLSCCARLSFSDPNAYGYDFIVLKV